MHTSKVQRVDNRGEPLAPLERRGTAKERYDAKTAYKVGLKLNKKTDTAIIEKLESVESKQGYIKRLILQDIAAHN